MASALGRTGEGCDECGDLACLNYKVEVDKKLCNSCYHQQENVLPLKNDEQWMCSYHCYERVGLFCLCCKCGICLQCVNDNMHAGHKNISIAEAEEHVRRSMKEALQSIDEEQRKMDALKDHLDNCERMKNDFFNPILGDVRRMGADEYKAIDDMLVAEIDEINQEFNRRLQELNGKWAAQLRAVEGKALERKRAVDEFCKSLSTELKEQRNYIDETADCRMMAKTLHERKNILEKNRILIECFKESNGKNLLMGGEGTLGSWEKNESNLEIVDITSKTAKACEDVKYLLPLIRDTYKDKLCIQRNLAGKKIG